MSDTTRAAKMQAQAAERGWELRVTFDFDTEPPVANRPASPPDSAPRMYSRDPLLPPPKLAILFGWKGASHKSVGRFSTFYFTRGFSTLQILPTSNSDNISMGHQWTKSIVRDVTALLKDMYLDSNGDPREDIEVVCICLANTGLQMYLELLSMMEEDPALSDFWGPRIRGTVFDSCPGALAPLSMARAGVAQLPDGLWKTLLFYFLLFFHWLVMKSPEQAHESAGFPLLTSSRVQQAIPLLYIYGNEGTPVVDLGFIDGLVAQQRTKGFAVERLRLDTTEHLEHFTLHPKEYTAAVDAFLFECMQRQYYAMHTERAFITPPPARITTPPSRGWVPRGTTKTP